LLYGAGAHPEPERALKAALVEAASTIRRERAPASSEALARAEALLEEPNLVQTIDGHIDQGRARGALDRRFPVAPGAVEWRGLFTRSQRPANRLTSFSRLAAACLGLCEDVLVVDQSRQPFTGRGIYAAKVLAPGLLPMTFGHRNRRVSARRLERVPGAVGAAIPADHLPHMFG
jgi:ribosomal protein S12 methylthiotransferase accessory factor